MSQGKAWNKEEVIEVLSTFLKLGCSVNKACNYAGIPQSTVQTWLENDEELRLKVGAWQNEMSTQARKVWKKAIEENQSNAAIQWLERKEKEEFSNRTDIKLEGELTSKIIAIDE